MDQIHFWNRGVILDKADKVVKVKVWLIHITVEDRELIKKGRMTRSWGAALFCGFNSRELISERAILAEKGVASWAIG